MISKVEGSMRQREGSMGSAAGVLSSEMFEESIVGVVTGVVGEGKEDGREEPPAVPEDPEVLAAATVNDHDVERVLAVDARSFTETFTVTELPAVKFEGGSYDTE
jgi:hypothetical protein